MPQLESKLVKDVKAVLKTHGAKAIKYHGSCYSEKGVPDILCCFLGRFIWMETKGPGETSSPAQVAVQQELYEAGAIGCEIFEVPEALALLEIVSIQEDSSPSREPIVDKSFVLRVVKRMLEERKKYT